jgi:hypothetical protein
MRGTLATFGFSSRWSGRSRGHLAFRVNNQGVP